jgi:hypothetical protein
MASDKAISYEIGAIKTYKENKKRVDNLIKTTDAHQLEDFLATAQEVLWDEEKKTQDYERLDMDKHKDKYSKPFKEKFAKRMTRRNLEELGLGEKEIKKILDDPIELDRRLFNFNQLTTDLIDDMILEHGKDFTYDAYQKTHGKKFIGRLAEAMTRSTYSHIDYEGLKKVVNHVTGGKINTELLTVRDRAALPYYLDNFLVNEKPISEKVLRTGPHNLLLSSLEKEVDKEELKKAA